MGAEAGKIQNILTVDVEDWFHICGVDHCLPRRRWSRLERRVVVNTLKLLDILDHYQVRATFFVLGWVAQRDPDLVREIARRGHEIATHGHSHRRVYTLSRAEFEADLAHSLAVLTPLATAPIRGFRAPEWSICDESLWALDVLARAGLTYDASMAPLPIIGNPDYPATPHRRATPHGDLWEIPPLVGRTPVIGLPVGGGWGLRVVPYMLIRYFIRRQHRRGAPAVIFIHPRELDHCSPWAALPATKRFVVSARIRRTETRLHQLLNDYVFTTISTFLAQKSIESIGATHYL